MPKSLVAATHPNINGIAPGKAPTNTDKGVFVFKGVYKNTYIKMDIAPNIAVCGFILYSTEIPTIVKIIAIDRAVVTLIVPAGIGLFLVLSIKESKSRSMI